jgi:NAD(P)-dependent dehydrogenase (short-subunit alcohol dehydrogenase family)
MLKKFNLKNKEALITGAGGLLGYEHAHALLEVGAKVFLADINLKSLKNSYEKLIKIFPKNKVFKIKIDVTSEKSVLKALRFFKKKKFKIDILINNAAFNPANKNFNSFSLEKYSLKNWKREIDVTLTGAFICSKIFGNEMSKNKTGVILNIASDLSVIAPDHRIYNKGKKIKFVKPVTYSVGKTGLVGLTRYLSTYWSDSNVRCNAISPGGVMNNHKSSFTKKLKKLIPLGRMANKDEYRSAIQFLCSDASSYMTGQNLVIDGGRSVW